MGFLNAIFISVIPKTLRCDSNHSDICIQTSMYILSFEKHTSSFLHSVFVFHTFIFCCPHHHIISILPRCSLLLSVYHSYLITLPSQHLYFNLHRREARSRNERRKGVKMQNLSWDIIYFIAYVYIVPIRSCSTSVKPVYLVRHE